MQHKEAYLRRIRIRFFNTWSADLVKMGPDPQHWLQLYSYFYVVSDHNKRIPFIPAAQIDILSIIDYQNNCCTLRVKWDIRKVRVICKISQNWPSPPGHHQHSEYTGLSHSTRHASRPWQCTTSRRRIPLPCLQCGRYFDPLFLSLYLYAAALYPGVSV